MSSSLCTSCLTNYFERVLAGLQLRMLRPCVLQNHSCCFFSPLSFQYIPFTHFRMPDYAVLFFLVPDFITYFNVAANKMQLQVKTDLNFSSISVYKNGTSFSESYVVVWSYSQQRTLMQAACRLFSARISDLMPMTRMLPKHVMNAMTQTDTRNTMLARRSSNDEMPSVLGLQDLT